jgi:ClpP class serine protease
MTAHSVQRLLSSLRNTPLLTTPEYLREIEDYLTSRNSSEDLAVASQAEARQESEEYVPTVENGIGLLTIEGALTYKHSWINSLCGIVSYQKLIADFESMIEQGAHTIVLDISSPGGMAHGCFETAIALREMADSAGVKIVTYVDMQACSAAYALACIADTVIMNPLAKVGSIGVVISIVNDLPKRIEEGSEVVFVYSGESKIPYEKDGKLREDFIADLQKDTDLLYQDFIKHVAQFRPMSQGEIRDTNAKTFRPTDAIRMGLADTEMTSQEFIDYLADLADDYDSKMNQQEERPKMPLFGWGRKKKDSEMSTQEDTQELASEAPEASEATPSELLEGNQEGGEEASVESSEKPSMQSKEDNEVNMDLEQLLASPEAQAKLNEMAEAKAAALKEKLAAFEAEKEAAAKASYVELVSGYSFVAKESQEKVATFLYEASEMGMDGVDQVMEALENAKMAVEAVVEEEHGDEGAALETDPDTASKATVSDLIKKRYAKQ